MPCCTPSRKRHNSAVSHEATMPVRVGAILASALPRRPLPGDGGSGAAAGSTAGSFGCNSITSACCAAAESDAFKVGDLRIWKPDAPDTRCDNGYSQNSKIPLQTQRSCRSGNNQEFG